MKVLEPLFNPKNLALIGASHSEGKLGGIILKNLLKSHCCEGGRLYPVNPQWDELMGVKSYSRVEELPDEIDIAVIIRPAEEVPQILRSLSGKAKFAVLESAGFSEVGQGELQEEVKRIGREAGIRLLGPNCMGVYNPSAGLDTMFLPEARVARPAKGNIAVTTQSGAVVSAIFETLVQWKMGISKAAHYGNAADIDESDLYEYLIDDDESGVVISYIESVRDGRRFIARASALAEKKPLLILKAGKGGSGQHAALSHTGRLAGNYQVFSSILKEFNITECMDLEDLMDSAKAFSLEAKRKGKKVFILTNGGGSGVLASDECARLGLEMASLPGDARDELKKEFPSYYVIGNPFDLTAQAKDEDYGKILERVYDSYEGFAVIALSAVVGTTEGLAKTLIEFGRKGKPLVFLTGMDETGNKLAAALEKGGVACYPTPERAVRALKRLLEP